RLGLGIFWPMCSTFLLQIMVELSLANTTRVVYTWARSCFQRRENVLCLPTPHYRNKSGQDFCAGTSPLEAFTSPPAIPDILRVSCHPRQTVAELACSPLEMLLHTARDDHLAG